MIDDATARILERIDAGLRREGCEGSVFVLPGGAVIGFATTTPKAHNCRYNIGRRPLVNRVREALGDDKADVDAWFGRLRGKAPADVPAPATLWNSSHLVVTEAISRDRLVTMFEHPEAWWPERLLEVATRIGVDGSEDLERAFMSATGRSLPERARQHYERIKDGASQSRQSRVLTTTRRGGVKREDPARAGLHPYPERVEDNGRPRAGIDTPTAARRVNDSEGNPRGAGSSGRLSRKHPSNAGSAKPGRPAHRPTWRSCTNDRRRQSTTGALPAAANRAAVSSTPTTRQRLAQDSPSAPAPAAPRGPYPPRAAGYGAVCRSGDGPRA